jgi:hypothetical protein
MALLITFVQISIIVHVILVSFVSAVCSVICQGGFAEHLPAKLKSAASETLQIAYLFAGILRMTPHS